MAQAIIWSIVDPDLCFHMVPQAIMSQLEPKQDV